MGNRMRKLDTSGPLTPKVPPKGRIPGFDNLKIFAYALIAAIFFAIVSLNDFRQEMDISAPPGQLALFVARLVLFAEFVVYAFRWIIATHKQFELWKIWLNQPFEKEEVYTAMFGLSIFLGVSLAYPHRIVFITGWMTTYFLFNYWAQWLANDHFETALAVTRGRLDVKESRALDAMEAYWLKRPQLGRITVMMFFSSISFALAFAGRFQQAADGDRFRLAAYCILILDLLVGEAVVARWRYKLDQGTR
jgi:hypothetical protein